MEPVVYYIVHRAEQAGPYTQEQLQEMLAREEITPNQLGWRDGMADWKPLSELLPPMLPRAAAPVPPPLPPRSYARTTPPAAKTPSKVWLWVTLAVVVVIGLLGTLIGLAVKEGLKDGTDEISFRPLLEDRAEHQPKWKKSSFEAAGPADAPDGKSFDLIRYHAPAGELAAYLTPDPKDGQKHPAMVWAHGGFGGIGSYFWEPSGKRNDQSARAFRENGIVLMCPSWRGENDNPGRFELFYGEVADFLAAIEHVKKLPYVDPDRVYIGGHSTGGTMTLLAACASDQFRAAFSFGGMMNGVATLEGEGYGNTPYPTRSTRDHRLRSPMRYAGFIRRPTFYFEGGDYYDEDAADLMQARAKNLFHPFHLPGDHFDILHPVTGLIAAKIAADKGAETSITITAGELNRAYQAAFANSLATHLERWSKSGGDLAEALKKADPDDAMPHTESDVKAIEQAVRRIASLKTSTPETTANMATLAGLRDEIDDQDILDAFDERALPPLIAWAQNRLKQSSSFDEKEAEHFLQILSALATCEDQRAADLVVHAARAGVGPGLYTWDNVLESFDEEHPQTEYVMSTFAENPPQGYIGVLLLDAANQLFLDEWEGVHPFDSSAGVKQLREWLENKDPEQSSYAHSAALGAAFISKQVRGDLIDIAFRHPDKTVRMEAAWADVKTGGKQGLDFLKQACLDIHQSARAQDYLEELDQENAVPNEASEPAFAAQAEMSRWLQHPNELGAEPLSIEVYDHKKLFWPPDEEQRDVFLLKFTYKFPDDQTAKTGYGMTGGMTWSSFEEYASPPKPEELYLHHCALELNRASKSEKSAKDEDNRSKALEALKRGNPGVFDESSLK